MAKDALEWLWITGAAVFVVAFILVTRRGAGHTVGRRMTFGYFCAMILVTPIQHPPINYLYAIASVFGLLMLFGGIFKKGARADTPLFEGKQGGRHGNNEDPS